MNAFAIVAAGTVALAGCALARTFALDSPTDFTQAGPVQMAASDGAIIFKSPTESNNCLLGNGAVTFVPVGRAYGANAPLRFSYERKNDAAENDVVTISTPNASLSISGRGAHSVRTRNGAALGSRERATLTLSADGTAFAIRATDPAGNELFRVTAIPRNGHVYLRDGHFSRAFPKYAGHAEHNCGNWNNAADAADALGRVEGRIPR